MERLLYLLKKPISLLNNEEKEELATGVEKLPTIFTVSDINLFIEQYLTLFSRILEKDPNDLNCIKDKYSESTLIDEKLLKIFAHYVWANGKNVTDEKITAIIKFIEHINAKKLSKSERIAFRRLCAILFDTIYYPLLNISVRIEDADKRQLKITSLCQEIILSDIPENIDDNERKQLFNIIHSHTLIYIMGDDYELFIKAHSLLMKLGMTEKERQELIEEKVKQLKNIDKYMNAENRKRT